MHNNCNVHIQKNNVQVAVCILQLFDFTILDNMRLHWELLLSLTVYMKKCSLMARMVTIY